MAFCMNCGNEVPDGSNFCPNCGTQVVSSVTPDRVVEAKDVQQQSRESVAFQQNTYTSQPPVKESQPSGLDKFSEFFGIILLIVAILDFNTDPAMLTIILSAGIIAGAIFCIKKEYKHKGFTCVALVLAASCLFAGVIQANKYGLFTMPSEEYVSSSTTKEKETAASQETQPQGKEQTGGVDPDLKAFLDSYEEFVNQYVEFMKKYNSDPDNMVSMLGEYGEMMQKYAAFAEKIEKYDSNSMSTEDYKYYIEVTTRCSQKMLEVY